MHQFHGKEMTIEIVIKSSILKLRPGLNFMYNIQGQQSSSHSNSSAGPSTGNPSSSSSSSGLPPLLLNARLHELVIAGTGQNERLEPALEHVNYTNYNYNL